MGGAAGGAEALIVDRCAHDQEVAAGETSHPALITYTNLIDSDHMGNLSPPTPGHWRYPTTHYTPYMYNLVSTKKNEVYFGFRYWFRPHGSNALLNNCEYAYALL